MRGRGLQIAAVLVVFSSAAIAQAQSAASPPSQTTDANAPPRPPTYTPEELFGPSAQTPAVHNPSTSGAPVSLPLPNTPNDPSNGTPASTGAPPACPTSSQPASPHHPGVSASQFRRAGVGAEAFTRPGVSAEQLNALRPGARRPACAPPRTVILHPEAPTPERRIPPPVDEP